MQPAVPSRQQAERQQLREAGEHPRRQVVGEALKDLVGICLEAPEVGFPGRVVILQEVRW